jgi:Cadherin-like
MAKDSSNTLAKAKLLNLLGGNGSLKESIGGRDRFDFIKINLTQRSSFNATLGDKLKAKTNLDLLDLQGGLLGRSAKPGTQIESIATVFNPGQYILKVSGKSKATRYRLNLNTALIPTPVPTNTAPTLSVNTGFSLTKGTTATLNGNLLKATDSEQQTLVYTLTQLPVAGKLKYKEADVAVGQTFTQSDIDSGFLTYLNAGGIQGLTNNTKEDFDPYISGSNVVWYAYAWIGRGGLNKPYPYLSSGYQLSLLSPTMQ